MDVSAVLAKIGQGVLPQVDWDWTRLTAGHPLRACVVCDTPTSAVDAAVECYRGDIGVMLHPDCYVLWEEARRAGRGD